MNIRIRSIPSFIVMNVVVASELFGQGKAHLKLSNHYPSAGDKVTLVYYPAKSGLNQKDLIITVFYVDNLHYPTEDVKLRHTSGSFFGTLTVPMTAKAFFVRISSGTTVDNNGGNGYVYLVYKGRKPVRGAYASAAYVLTSGLAYDVAGIKTDIPKGLALFQKEYNVYPQTLKDTFYDKYTDNYALALQKQKQIREALQYEKLVYDRSGNENLTFNEHYAEILDAAGQAQQAMTVITNSIISGRTSDILKEQLKRDFVRLNGSAAGFQKFIDNINSKALLKLKKEIAKEGINYPAPLFSLKAMSGNVISLSDLKGKIVVLDFWATWCNPCKQSLPGMQMAVDKYRNDNDVRFLFIDCWETAAGYRQLVQKLISDNHYNLDVLFDKKGNDGRLGKVLNRYKVDGIPTKFIIDRNGNIRFKFVGYTGSSESLLNEVSIMIDIARAGH